MVLIVNVQQSTFLLWRAIVNYSTYNKKDLQFGLFLDLDKK